MPVKAVSDPAADIVDLPIQLDDRPRYHHRIHSMTLDTTAPSGDKRIDSSATIGLDICEKNECVHTLCAERCTIKVNECVVRVSMWMEDEGRTSDTVIKGEGDGYKGRRV